MELFLHHEDDYSLSVESNPSAHDSDLVRGQLLSFNARAVGNDNHETLAVFAKAKDAKVIGGLLGGTYWGWLHIDILWVDENYRRKGIGSKLLDAAERAATKRKCENAHVETHDFQSPEFYVKNGYTIFAEINDLPQNHKKIFLKKNLRRES
jgi:ribosomal protein S18 acetylase RimI-like enzyme